MSKKPLLNESTVRQFMKFANLGGLADKFVNEAYMQEDEMEERQHKQQRQTTKPKKGIKEDEMEEGHEEGHMEEALLPWSPSPWVLDSRVSR